MAGEQAPAPAGDDKAGSGKAPLLGVLAGALVGALVSAGVVWTVLSHKQASKPSVQAANAAKPSQDSFFDLDEFLVNLSNPDGDRYVRTTISLSFSNELARDAIKAQLPKVRDAIIEILADQSTETMVTEQGRAAVKEKVLAQTQKMLPQAGFDGVYFQLLTFQ